MEPHHIPLKLVLGVEQIRFIFWMGLVGMDVGDEGGVEDKFGEGGVGQWRRREWRVWRHWRRDLTSKNLQ